MSLISRMLTGSVPWIGSRMWTSSATSICWPATSTSAMGFDASAGRLVDADAIDLDDPQVTSDLLTSELAKEDVHGRVDHRRRQRVRQAENGDAGGRTGRMTNRICEVGVERNQRASDCRRGVAHVVVARA